MFGFTDRVPELMAACDVVITTSGDTCREARAVGRSIILLDVVSGHGRENLMHELEKGGSRACLPGADSIGRAVAALVADPDRSDPVPTPRAGVAEAQFVAALERTGLRFAATPAARPDGAAHSDGAARPDGAAHSDGAARPDGAAHSDGAARPDGGPPADPRSPQAKRPASKRYTWGATPWRRAGTVIHDGTTRSEPRTATQSTTAAATRSTGMGRGHVRS